MFKDNRKAILSAAYMVLIAAMLLIYTAYAWMTITRTVKAQGIELSVTTSNDLQISLTGGDDISEWSDEITINMKEIVESQLDDFNIATDTFYLLPASTYSAFNNEIFTTKRAMTNGFAYEDTVFDIAQTVTKNMEAYEGNYIDIPLYFRTGSDLNATIHLIKTIGETDATYIVPIDGSDIAKTVRIAFLNEDGSATSIGGDNTHPLVYANSDHGVTPSVINAQYPVLPEDKPAPDYMQFSSDSNISDDTIFNLVGAVYGSGNVSYTVKHITVRIWIEGQDENCVVSIGGKSFSVGLGFVAEN